MSLVIVSAGHHLTLQDLGRYRVSRFGLSQGGAADLHAHCWGQKLLGNPCHTASIEIVLGKAQFRASADMTIVMTGADCDARIGSSNRAIPNWQPFHLKQGEELLLGLPRNGLRSYLSVKGGFNVPLTLGSASAIERNQVGGLANGLPLAAGDQLALAAETDSLIDTSIVMPQSAIPDYPRQQTLHLIPSYQYSSFSNATLQHLLSQTYRISPDSNRMGVRLEPNQASCFQVIDNHYDANIISEGIVTGSVQVPDSGLPIIMLQDRQTLGGYKKLGTIAFRDLAKLAQMRPGDSCNFKLTALELERLKQQAFYRYFDI
ncbi:biotin-dependent carboxyltransferase family protein [Vibrio hippocampi]|uniref:5-oxoprolinase subunit C n=1 Tax=Vibrio hippocampi TaxID=654686 RepID=A0ABN8DEI1_9VIBR|nr:biotin-dependent carboxyltransferase family protein [Vibrio hippocampi]CAH0525120.1 5-oxoprolinase subunit C [Vibrio hippocampi]